MNNTSNKIFEQNLKILVIVFKYWENGLTISFEIPPFEKKLVIFILKNNYFEGKQFCS